MLTSYLSLLLLPNLLFKPHPLTYILLPAKPASSLLSMLIPSISNLFDVFLQTNISLKSPFYVHFKKSFMALFRSWE